MRRDPGDPAGSLGRPESISTALGESPEAKAAGALEELYRRRRSRRPLDRLVRLLTPPPPLLRNPAEPRDFVLGRWNLYLGSAGVRAEGYVNVDLLAMAGVDVAANAEQMPFGPDVFQHVECDAVLEHVRDPVRVMEEIRRVLVPGGSVHVVTPFCHPYHGFPGDYRRFTIEGLKEMARGMEVVAEGWRTGPAATFLVFLLEFAKLLLPWKIWRVAVHGVLGWLLFPLRYLDLVLLRKPDAYRMGNHCYLVLRKKA